MKKNLLFSALCAVLLLAVWFVAAPQAPSAGPKSPEARVDGFRGDRKAEVDTVAGLGRGGTRGPRSDSPAAGGACRCKRYRGGLAAL